LRLRLNNKQETQTGPENRGHFFGLLPVLDARRRVSSSCSTKTCVLKSLRFRRDASRYASLAHFYCAFGMAFLRGCYHQILGPLLHLPKFGNGLCGYSDASVHLDSHLIWQAAKSYVERGSAFGFISHKVTARYRLSTAENSLQPLRAVCDGSKTYLVRPSYRFS